LDATFSERVFSDDDVFGSAPSDDCSRDEDFILNPNETLKTQDVLMLKKCSNFLFDSHNFELALSSSVSANSVRAFNGFYTAGIQAASLCTQGGAVWTPNHCTSLIFVGCEG
jgi:hypothetical protein